MYESHTLSADQEKRLSAKLREMVAECDQVHRDFRRDRAQWRDFYLTQPEFDRVDYPWPDAANYMLPVVRVAVDGFLSQVWEAMFGNDPFVEVRAVADPSGIFAAEALSIYYDQFFNRIINFKGHANDWLFNTVMDGVGVMRNRASMERLLRYRTEVEEKPVIRKFPQLFEGSVVEFPQIVGIRQQEKEVAYLDESVSIGVETADMDRLYVPPDCGPSLQWPHCRYYYIESWLSKEDLAAKRAAGWKGIDDELLAFAGSRPKTDAERAEDDALGLGGESRDMVRCLEFCMRLVMPHDDVRFSRDGSRESRRQSFMDEGGVPEEVIATWFPDTQKVARIVPLDRVRGDNKRPDVDMRFGRLPGRFHSMGMPARLADMQAGHTSLFNMMIDLGHLVNFPYVFSDGPAADGDGYLPLEPGRQIPLNGSRFETFRPNGDPAFYNAVMTMLQAWEEKDGSVSDFTLGVSPGRPNAPRTFRGTQQLLNQASIAFSYRVSQFAERFEELFRQVHALHRRHPPDEMELRVDEVRTQVVLPGMFQRDVDLKFVVNPNRQYDVEVATQLFSALGPLIAQTRGPEAVRPLARELYKAMKRGNNANFEELWPQALPPQVGLDPGLGGPGQLGPGQQPPAELPGQVQQFPQAV